MASIYGVQIKGYKTFLDHEGMEIGQGNIYLNGKKLGFWSQDSWGGPDRYDFDKSALKEMVEKYKKSDMVDKEYLSIFDTDIFIYELVKLLEVEKGYKKCVKSGYSTYVRASDGYHIMGYYTNDKKEDVPNTKYYKTFVKKCDAEFFKNKKTAINIYGSLEDFNVA